MIRQIGFNVEYAGDDKVKQDMVDRLFKIVRCFGMEMNEGKATVMRIPMQPPHIQIMIDQKQPENVEYFRYLGSRVTKNARSSRENKSTQKEDSFPQKIGLHYIRKELVNPYIWIIAVFGAETWKIRKVDQKCLESFGMCCSRRTEKIIWTDHV
jgi:hypothetical protein